MTDNRCWSHRKTVTIKMLPYPYPPFYILYFFHWLWLGLLKWCDAYILHHDLQWNLVYPFVIISANHVHIVFFLDLAATIIVDFIAAIVSMSLLVDYLTLSTQLDQLFFLL